MGPYGPVILSIAGGLFLAFIGVVWRMGSVTGRFATRLEDLIKSFELTRLEIAQLTKDFHADKDGLSEARKSIAVLEQRVVHLEETAERWNEPSGVHPTPVSTQRVPGGGPPR